MAAGNRIGKMLPGTTLRSFRAARVDEIVDELSLDKVDLIKMDIEGAEIRALLRRTRDNRPFQTKSCYFNLSYARTICGDPTAAAAASTQLRLTSFGAITSSRMR